MAEREGKNSGNQRKHSKGKRSNKNVEGKDGSHQHGTELKKELFNMTEKLVPKSSSIVQNNCSEGNNSPLCGNDGNNKDASTETKHASEGGISTTSTIHKTVKSREEVLVEREARKLAKQALKKKGKESTLDKVNKSKTNTNIIEEGRAQMQNDQPEKENLQVHTREIEKPAQVSVIDADKVETICHEDSKDGLSKMTGNQKNEGKSKAQLRAERRAKQEAQRAKKLDKANAFNKEKISQAPQLPKSEKLETKATKTVVQVQDKIHKVKLFAHLYSELFDTIEIDLCEDAHPSIVQLGTQYRSKVISGGNARCLALLSAFKTIIQDYETPPNQELSRGLEAEISRSMVFLNKCRPVAVSMINAVKHLKFQVNQLKGEENEVKKQLNDWIDIYIKEQIEKASEAISLSVLQKITNEDVILIYSCSSLIQRILIKAREENIKFRVIVVDGRPWLEGKEMLRRLVRAGINCTYVFFNGLSFIMPEVTKILLGAHALLANGYVMSRAGSSQIALLAKAYNVPVLVCCETHKFSEKVQTDSFVHNELGDPDKLIITKGRSYKDLSNWKNMQYLTPLNLTYDVTPPDLVSAVVTEIAVLPCTSVPVILRIKPPDIIC